VTHPLPADSTVEVPIAPAARATTAAAMPGAASCANCGGPVGREYCGDCGQSRDGLDRSVWSFLREAVEEVFNLEGRTLRTLRPLLLEPGAVTAEYFAGRRVRYTPPLRLYLVASAAFFLGYLVTRDVNQAYYGYPAFGSASAYANAMARVLVLLIPTTAIVLKLLYLRTGRTLVHHLVFSLHLGAAALTWFLTLTLVAAALKAVWGHHSAAPAWLPDFVIWLYLPGLVVMVGYIVAALRRAYGTGWGGAITRGVALLAVIVAFFFTVVPRLLSLLEVV
jgi:hypothetical protein